MSRFVTPPDPGAWEPPRSEHRGAPIAGRFLIERQDGTTECDHPMCDQFHERFKGPDGLHWTKYVQWHVWDLETDDYADYASAIEFERKRDAKAWLDRYMEREGIES